MSTSGNTSWDLQSTAIVNSAYRKIGYLAEGQTLSTEALANGVEALNSIIPFLQTKGMPLWKRTSTVLTPSATSQVYTVASAVKVVEVYLTDSSGSQYDLEEKSLYDFNNLPSSAGAGVPVSYTVQPTIADSTIRFWPFTSDTGTIATKTMVVVYQKKFDGMFNATDTIDFPSYWLLGVMLKLATILAPESGLPLQDRTMLHAECKDAIDGASDYGDEDGSLFVQPNEQM